MVRINAHRFANNYVNNTICLSISVIAVEADFIKIITTYALTIIHMYAHTIYNAYTYMRAD